MGSSINVFALTMLGLFNRVGKGVNSQRSSGAQAEDRECAFPRQRDEVDFETFLSDQNYLQLARHRLAGARRRLVYLRCGIFKGTRCGMFSCDRIYGSPLLPFP